MEEQVVKNKIFGIRPVMEALQAEKTIEKIMLREGVNTDLFQMIQNTAKQQKVPIQWVPAERLDRLAKGGNHQGVVAFVAATEYADLEEIMNELQEEGEMPFILLLDQITDVRNFGAIARTAECAGVHAIVVPAKGAAPLSADAMKTSAGALNYIPVCRVPNLKTAIFLLKNYDVQIVAATEKSDSDHFAADFNRPTAIILGAEDTGISRSNLDLSDCKVGIPLQGSIESLNVSAAAAVLMFECVRQRKIAAAVK